MDLKSVDFTCRFTYCEHLETARIAAQLDLSITQLWREAISLYYVIWERSPNDPLLILAAAPLQVKDPGQRRSRYVRSRVVLSAPEMGALKKVAKGRRMTRTQVMRDAIESYKELWRRMSSGKITDIVVCSSPITVLSFELRRPSDVQEAP